MKKHSPTNERIKRKYFAYLKEAKRHSEPTVDATAKALSRFEYFTKYRDFILPFPKFSCSFMQELMSKSLIKLALAQSDFPNTLQLLFKIFFAKNGAVIFQALVIHGITLDGELLNNTGCPFTELYGALRVDLIANGDNSREIVMIGVIIFAVCGSYSKISNN
jgi:hypothetical protein